MYERVYFFFFFLVVNNVGELVFISMVGVNRYFIIEDIMVVEIVIKFCFVMVCDKGIFLKIVVVVLKYGKSLDCRILFNFLLKVEFVLDDVYVNIDVLVFNKEEGESLISIVVCDFEGVKNIILEFYKRGILYVVLIFGLEGVIFFEMILEYKSELFV